MTSAFKPRGIFQRYCWLTVIRGLLLAPRWPNSLWFSSCLSRIGWAGMATFLLLTHARVNCRPKMGSRKPFVSCRDSAGSGRPGCSVTTSLQDNLWCAKIWFHMSESHVSFIIKLRDQPLFQTVKPSNSCPHRDAPCLISLGVRTCWGGGGGGGKDTPCQALSGIRQTSHGGVFPVMVHCGFISSPY